MPEDVLATSSSKERLGSHHTGSAPGSRTQARPKRAASLFEARFHYVLLIPILVFSFVVVIFPFAYSFYLSFTSYNLVHRHMNRFIGLRNYVELASDPLFWQSLGHNLLFMVICINVEFVLGLAIAVLLNRPFPGRRIVRLILMVPLMLAPLLVGLQFKWFFDDRAGVLNAFLGLLGATQRPIGWLSDPKWALFSLMIAEIWQNTPFMILVFMAGLAGLSQEVLEAAEVDGANAWQRFRYVTFPMLGPLISIALTIRSLDAARVYDIVMIMTKGGPGNSTEMLGTFIYRTAITRRTFGYAAAISYVSLIVTFLFAALLIRQIIKSRKEAL